MNFTSTPSKYLIKSASSSVKCVTHSKEKPELNGEIESLKQIIQSLKISIESRDAAIGKLAREKEKVFFELKGAQRTIRDLRQQLSDERTIHTREKDYLVEEIQRLSSIEELKVRQTNGIQKEQNTDSIQNQLLKKDEIINKLCAKYMKLKNNKSSLHRKVQRMKTEIQETRSKTICLLEENKHTMDKLFKKKLISSPVPFNSKKYLKLLNQNIKLQYENAQLKLCLSTITCIAKERDTTAHEDHNCPMAAPPSRQPQKPLQTHILSEENLQCSPTPHRRHIKWRPRKLIKPSHWFTPAVCSLYKLPSLYRKHSLSAPFQDCFRKSTSMPCLR